MVYARNVLAFLAIGALVAAMGGCGVRGGLDVPLDAKADGTATSGEAADAGAKSAAPPKPHQGFILDGLIR